MMNRRLFLRNLGTAGMIAALPGCFIAKNKKSNLPNIILFITGDQDKESIGAYGSNAYTPNLNRLAKEGMLCHNAYISSTVCTPSRYSLLTGRYASRCYSKQYLNECPPGTQGFPEFNVSLEDDNMNIGATLRDNGYVTGYVGKFHVGPHINNKRQFKEHGLEYVPPNSEPDEQATQVFQKNERWYRKYLKQKGFTWVKNVYWGNLQHPFHHHNPEWTIDAALEFIHENRERPFYLHYCTTLVHGPDRSWRRSMDYPLVSGVGNLESLPGIMTDRKEILSKLGKMDLDPEKGHAGYTWVDDSVGAVMKKLDELGIADNTLLIFVGDHGSRMKGSMFHKDGLNVPCIMRWPNKIKAGIETDELVQSIDFVPTFFEMVKADVPSNYIVDGRSMLPLFKSNGEQSLHESLYFEIWNARAVCTKGWKYIAVRYPKKQIKKIKKAPLQKLPKLMSYFSRLGIGTRGSSNPNFFDGDQLYHLTSDPLEKNNLANNPDYLEQLQKMRACLKEHLEKIGRPFGEFLPGPDTSPGGLIDEQIEAVKTVKIRHKTVILPDGKEYKEN